MTFLAPWAFAIGVFSAAGALFLHLVARQRPAAYLLPTARFIPDQQTLVSRIATRPHDLALLLLRMLLLLCAGSAFARPVLTPARGTIAHIVLLDRSRAVANVADAARRARALVRGGAPVTVIAFDTVPTILARIDWDSLAGAPRSESAGSLTVALVAARRASVALADQADSVQIHLVSPLAASEVDSATARARAQWPGAIRIARLPMRLDTTAGWHLDRPLPASDQLGPALGAVSVHTPRASEKTTRVVRGVARGADSAFAREGGTVVRWDTSAAPRIAAEGLAAGDDVIVAALGRLALSTKGRVVARWSDGTSAAVEKSVGRGCIRMVGVLLPAGGDIALHPPFQRIARGLIAPCGRGVAETASDSGMVRILAGSGQRAAPAASLRNGSERPSPLARWLLAVALLLAAAELVVRARAVKVAE